MGEEMDIDIEGIGEIMRAASDVCPYCLELDDACAGCAKAIHEGWHEKGWYWIRSEECHENCPGLTTSSTKQDASLSEEGTR